DEARVAGRLSPAEHRAAALLILGLPGPTLLHEGQLEGAHVRAPVHLRRRLTEPVDADIAALYEELLAAWRESAVGSGPRPGRVLRPERVSPEDDLAEKVILVLWPGPAGGFDLVVANITATAGSCRVTLPEEMTPGVQWEMRDRLAPRSGGAVQADGESGLRLQVSAHAARLLQFVPVSQVLDSTLRFTPLTTAS